MKIVVINNVTLDGVMQAPGRVDEDTREGFAHGGWASQNVDEPDPRSVQRLAWGCLRAMGCCWEGVPTRTC